MAWTKQQLVEQAFVELALGNQFDLDETELQTAMRRMDAMLATWNGKGIRLGYPLPGSPGGSRLEDSSNLPDWANEAVFLNLAMRLAPGYGKVISAKTEAAAREGYELVASRAAMPPQVQYPNTLPMGAGNKPWRQTDRPFMPGPSDTIDAGGDATLNFD